MLGMGATLAIKDFFKVLRHPSGVSIGVSPQWLVVPALAVLVGKVFGLGPGWAVGFLLVAVTPGGAFSNLLTYVARGHLALSIAVTCVATVCCIFTAPAILRFTVSGYMPPDFALPAGRILFEVCLYLLLPLAGGMAALHLAPKRAPALSKVAIWTSLVLVVIIAAGALTTGKLKIAAHGWSPPLLILGFAFLIHLAAAEVARLFGRTDDEVIALAIEVSVRNGGVGLLLLQFFFPGQEEQGHALYTVLLYTGLQIWVPIPGIIRHRKGKSPIWPHEARPGSEKASQRAAAEP